MKLHRTSARNAPNSRRREKSEIPVSANQEEKRENLFGFCGNAVQDVWEATQKTVKQMKFGSSKSRAGVEAERDVEQTKPLFLDSEAPSRRSRSLRNRRTQFQLVMTELKAKTPSKKTVKDVSSENPPDHDDSPTNIQHASFMRYGDQEKLLHQTSCEEDKSYASSSEHDSPQSIKNWLSKTAIFQKTTPISERHQFGTRTIQFRKLPFQNLAAGRGNAQNVKAREVSNGSAMEGSDLPIVNKRIFRFGIEPGTQQRKGVRANLLFRRKGNPGILQKSNSIGNVTLQKSNSLGNVSLQTKVLFDDCGHLDYEEADYSSDALLVAQIQDLLRAMDICEQKLANVRLEGERNRLELRSEVYHLKQVISSFTNTQELRYRRLLDGLDENYRTLCNVESSFDYFFSILNRLKRSTFQHQFKGFMFHFLDRIVDSLLTIVHVAATFYCRYRLKRQVPNARAPM